MSKESTMKFYCVNTKDFVELPLARCVKVKYPRANKAGYCYAVKGVDGAGHKLTTFVTKPTWEELQCKEF